MTKAKSTKRALLSSALVLVMCVAMLIGTTFAWFTDSVTSGTNKIVAGNLDVELYHTNSIDNEEKVTNTTPLFDGIELWEPGAMVWEKLTVKNVGSLALKYSLKINVTDISEVNGKSLADVLKVAVLNEQPTRDNIKTAATKSLATFALSSDKALHNEESDDFYVAIYWAPSSNDNDYNVADEALHASLGVTLLATQYTFESDSFNNEYDKDALYAVGDGLYIDEEDGSYVALDTKGLTSASELASTDPSITSVTLVTDEGEVEVPVITSASDLSAAAKSKEEIVVLTSGNYTVPTTMVSGQEIDIVGNKDTKINITNGYVNPSGGGAIVNFTGVTFNVSGYTSGMGNGTKATYTDCTFNAAEMYLYGSSKFINCTFNDCGTYALWTWGAETAEFVGCTFNTTGKAIYANVGNPTHQTVIITDCKFYDTGDNDTQKAAIETGDDYGGKTIDLIITNTTVEGFAVTEDKTSVKNYGGNNLGTNVWGNKYQMGTDKLNVVIDGVDVY